MKETTTPIPSLTYPQDLPELIRSVFFKKTKLKLFLQEVEGMDSLDVMVSIPYRSSTKYQIIRYNLDVAHSSLSAHILIGPQARTIPNIEQAYSELFRNESRLGKWHFKSLVDEGMLLEGGVVVHFSDRRVVCFDKEGWVGRSE